MTLTAEDQITDTLYYQQWTASKRPIHQIKIKKGPAHKSQPLKLKRNSGSSPGWPGIQGRQYNILEKNKNHSPNANLTPHE